MSTITEARAVLKRWREDTSAAPWHACEPDDGEPLGITTAGWHGMVAEGTGRDTALIVGTAGNPALLDALDSMFEAVLGWTEVVEGEVIYPEHIERIAEAIVAADKDMNP